MACSRARSRSQQACSAGPSDLLGPGAQSLDQLALESLDAFLCLFTLSAIVLTDFSTLADRIEQTAGDGLEYLNVIGRPALAQLGIGIGLIEGVSAHLPYFTRHAPARLGR